MGGGASVQKKPQNPTMTRQERIKIDLIELKLQLEEIKMEKQALLEKMKQEGAEIPEKYVIPTNSKSLSKQSSLKNKKEPEEEKKEEEPEEEKVEEEKKEEEKKEEEPVKRKKTKRDSTKKKSKKEEKKKTERQCSFSDRKIDTETFNKCFEPKYTETINKQTIIPDKEADKCFEPAMKYTEFSNKLSKHPQKVEVNFKEFEDNYDIPTETNPIPKKKEVDKNLVFVEWPKKEKPKKINLRNMDLPDDLCERKKSEGSVDSDIYNNSKYDAYDFDKDFLDMCFDYKDGNPNDYQNF
ncbi:MAG: hypothetical protein MJ252_01610 [archaeon]|nr:hypothetical protein [archaeon]